jgi:hypothetical protein
MLRYLSTGSSVIATLMAADEMPASGAMRPDLLEFLLVRTLAAHERARPPGDVTDPTTSAPHAA